MGKAYIAAVRDLLDECERQGLYNDEVANLMSVLRGPDEGHNGMARDNLKAIYTAPLRTYLLGRTACKAACYGPVTSGILPEAPITFGHFDDHITRALHIIDRREVRSAEERGL